MTSTHRTHGYSYTRMDQQQMQYKMVEHAGILYLPNGDTIEVAPATGKHCTNDGYHPLQ